eukprot:gene19426-23261_t
MALRPGYASHTGDIRGIVPQVARQRLRIPGRQRRADSLDDLQHVFAAQVHHKRHRPCAFLPQQLRHAVFAQMPVMVARAQAQGERARVAGQPRGIQQRFAAIIGAHGNAQPPAILLDVKRRRRRVQLAIGQRGQQP